MYIGKGNALLQKLRKLHPDSSAAQHIYVFSIIIMKRTTVSCDMLFWLGNQFHYYYLNTVSSTTRSSVLVLVLLDCNLKFAVLSLLGTSMKALHLFLTFVWTFNEGKPKLELQYPKIQSQHKFNRTIPSNRVPKTKS